MYVERIKTDNIINETRKVMKEYIDEWSKKDEVIGIVFLGGVAKNGTRKFIDEFSDIDIAIFLDIPEAEGYISSKEFSNNNQDKIPKWLPSFRFNVDVCGKPKEVNVHQLIIQIEKNNDREWGEFKKEAYLYDAEILYDYNGEVNKLINKKCIWNKENVEKRLFILMSQIQWYGWINPEIQYYRGFPWHSHMLLNEAFELILEAIYLIKGRYRPHMKWRLEIAIDIFDDIENFGDLSKEFIIINDYSINDIDRRSRIIKYLYDVLDKKVRKYLDIDDKLDYFDYVSIYIDEDRQLLYNMDRCNSNIDKA